MDVADALERAALNELWALRKEFTEDLEDLLSYEVTKARPEDRYTLGPFYIPNRNDAHGEWTDVEELQKALWGYARKGNRDIMLQHSKTKAGEWVELMSWPQETSVDLFLPDGAFSKAMVRKATFPAGTAYIGVVWEPWAWDLVKAGKVRGMSMGGRSGRIGVEFDEATMAKYNPNHDPHSGEFSSGMNAGRGVASGGLNALIGAPGISGYGGSPDTHTPTPGTISVATVGTPFSEQDPEVTDAALADLHDEIQLAGYSADGKGGFTNSDGERITVTPTSGGIIASQYDSSGSVRQSEMLRSAEEVADSDLMARLFVEQSLNDIMQTGGITKAKVSLFLDRLWAYTDAPLTKYNHVHDRSNGEFARAPGGGSGTGTGSTASLLRPSPTFVSRVEAVEAGDPPPREVAVAYARERGAPVPESELLQATPNAQRVLTQATAARPGVQRGVRAAARTAGGDLEPPTRALKGLESLSRKIATDRVDKGLTMEQATGGIADALRYSILLDEKNFKSGALDASAKMRAQGYEPITAKPFFDTSKSAYIGYNTTWRDPNTGTAFELQMHTQDTAYFARKVIHPYFEAFRVSDSQPGDAEMRRAASAKMQKLSGLVTIPPGAKDLPAYDNRTPATAWTRGGTVENMPHALTVHDPAVVTQADSHGFAPGDPRNGDPQLAAKVANIEALQKRYIAEGRATDMLYEHNPDFPGRYTAFREAVHVRIRSKRLAAASNVPNNHEAVIFGGIPGAGKGYAFSTLGPEALGFDVSQHMVINPDDMKAELAAVDPNDYQGLQPGETAPLLHEEGSTLAKDLAREAMAQGKNLMWDITMASPGSVQARIEDLRKAGYTIKFAFVQTPPMVAASRAVHRWQTPGEEGRYVSIDQYADLAREEETTGKTPNRATFELLRDSVDGWVLVDSSGKGNPRVVARG